MRRSHEHSGKGVAAFIPPDGPGKVFSLASRISVLATLGGCSGRGLTFLDPQGPIAAAQRSHLFEVTLLLLVVVLPVLIFAPWVAWRYRYRNTASRYTPKWSFAWALEIAVWGVPFAIVIALSFMLLRSTSALDPYKPIASHQRALRIQVIGYDWKWLFIYPDLGIASVGEMAFPAGRPLALELTSTTVMQSFHIPALGSQMYAMGGMVTKLHLMADRPGSFMGENTLFNGRGFHLQKFEAVALQPEAFENWVDRLQRQGLKLTPHAMQVLSERSTMSELRVALPADTPNGVLYLNGAPPGLFAEVVAATMKGSSALSPSDKEEKTKMSPGTTGHVILVGTASAHLH